MNLNTWTRNNATAILLNDGGYESLSKLKFPLEVTGNVLVKIDSESLSASVVEVKHKAFNLKTKETMPEYLFDLGEEILINTIDGEPLCFSNSGKANNRLLTWSEYRGLVVKCFIKKGVSEDFAEPYSYGFFDCYKEYLNLKCKHDIEADVEEEMSCWYE